jgi:VWFA-related protein
LAALGNNSHAVLQCESYNSLIAIKEILLMRRTIRLLPAFLFCLILFNSNLQLRAQVAQAAADDKKAAPAEMTKFSTRTQLVLVPVVVTGKNGSHMSGLTRDAFRIEEHGRVRQATIFEEVKSVAPDAKARAVTAPVAGHANFSFGNSESWRLTVVVMDMVNTPYLAQHEAKLKLINYLGKNLQRDEPTALLGLGRSGLTQLHPFTTDTPVLIAALKKVAGQVGTVEMNDESAQLVADMTNSLDVNSVSQSADTISQFMQDVDATARAFQQRDAIRTTLEAMTQIAHAYEAIPGRKTLIWASGGFPFMIDDPQAFARMGTDMVEQYEETWRALASAGMAVYTVDVTGLAGFSGTTAGFDASRSRGTISPGGSRMNASKPMTIPYDKDQQRKMTMRAFADATGGVACVNTNDLEKCFARAVEDSRSYYLLGYYLPADDQQPGWRKLKVKVDAEGAHVRAREGFYVGAAVEDTPQARQRQMVEALRSPVEFTGIRMNVREVAAGAEKQAAGKTRHQFVVGMPAKSVTLDAQNGNNVDLSIVALAFDTKGKNAGQGENHVAGKLKAETAEKIKRSGLAAEVGVELPPGTYDMHFAVRDNLNGEVGSVVFPLEVK